MKYKNFTEKANIYFKLFRTFARDSVWRFKGRSFLVISAGFLGVTFQVQAIGLAVYYARSMAEGDIIKIVGYEFPVRSSLAFLTLIGIGVIASLLLSAWLIYYSRSGILKLARQYDEFCSKRLLAIFGSSLRVWSPAGQFLRNDLHVMKLARTDARYCGRVLRILLGAIVPLITLIISVCALIYINVLLTLLILVLMGISAAFQYRVSLSGAQSTTLMEEASGRASLVYRNFIQRQRESSLSDDEKNKWLDNAIHDGAVKHFFDAYEGRLTVIEKSRLISDVLLAVAIFAIIVGMGVRIISGGHGWGDLIIYLVALRYMLVNLKQSVTKLTSINRFFPQLKRYFQFLENAKTQSRDGETLPARYVITCTNMIGGSLQQYELSPNSRLGLISPVDLNRYTISYLTDTLLGNSQEDGRHALNSMWFITSRFTCLPGTLKESFGFPDSYGSADFVNDMNQAGLIERARRYFPQDLETSVLPETWAHIETDLTTSLALLAAARSANQWIVLEESVISILPHATREFFFHLCSGKIVMIVYNGDSKSIGNYNENIIAVINETSVIGLGSADWARNNEAVIRDVLSRSPLAESRQGGIDDDLDSDMDEDDM